MICNSWISGFEGAECKFGVASITEGDSILRVDGDGNHDETARLTPSAGLLIAVGFGFSGRHHDRQWPVGNKESIWSRWHDAGGTAIDEYAPSNCEEADNMA